METDKKKEPETEDRAPEAPEEAKTPRMTMKKAKAQIAILEKGQQELATYRKFAPVADMETLIKVHGSIAKVAQKLAQLDFELNKDRMAVIKKVGFGTIKGEYYLTFDTYIDDKAYVSMALKEAEWKPFMESNQIANIRSLEGRTCWVKIAGESVSLINLTKL